VTYCTKFGTSLHSTEEREHYRRVDDECLGIPRRNSVASLVFGIIWIVTPNFSTEVIDFAENFHLEHFTEHIILPAPKESHPVVYTAAMQFCLVFGAFQTVILVLRFIFHDSVNRKSGTISNITFWFSTSFFLNMLVNEPTGWFGFLAGLIISIGLAIIASSVVKLFK